MSKAGVSRSTILSFAFVAPLRAEYCKIHTGLRFYPTKRAAAREIDARMKFDASRLRSSRRSSESRKNIFLFD
jgi:hypothetical protein